MGFFNNSISWGVSILRLGRGRTVDRNRLGARPEQTLILYEFEACPFCRKAREVMTELDLPYISYPCARGSRYREEVIAKGGKKMFPYLIDPNREMALYESEDIITYLNEHYGKAPRSVWSKAAAFFNTIGSFLASAPRPLARYVGKEALPAPPEQMLVLYNMEASPYCRKVREMLNVLDLPCHMINVGREGSHRAELSERGGKMMIPFLIDPNTNTELYESDEIIAYLKKQYAHTS